ncbi:type II toxin-antitoxin system mRNA interferase toxin, RelE/StbE family [Candidatus Peregrinibacteria bacterium CG10_big_fil_rev_8_21_14_0_10_49_10]|nr:MAG: type II toxin-antitoxin system mRNA interferase toxin, RelE/StbE family [Candidatus Peregrinibacteria bacterium CG10_big_fil_rev_8_21_14_0_10_49_10]
MKRYSGVATKQFKKDLRRLRQANADLTKLECVIDLLAAGKNLDDSYRDHPLKGNLKGKRECHISSDWLLLYEKDEEKLLLLLLRTGDHRHVLNRE